MGIITFPRLVTDMKLAVRGEVQADPKFIHGAMRFLFCPKTPEAMAFLGGFDKDFVDIEVAAPVVEGGSMILPANYWG